jgi:hypothetical protein
LFALDARHRIADLLTMSAEPTGPIDLAFIGRALQRLTTGGAGMRGIQCLRIVEEKIEDAPL